MREALDSRVAWGAAARAHCTAHFGLTVVVDKWDALLRAVLTAA